VTAWLVWLVCGLGIAAAVVRQRSLAAGAVALQTVLVGVGALALMPGRSGEFAIAAVILAAKGALVVPLLAVAVARTREARPVRDPAPPLLRLVVTVAMVLVIVAAMPPLSLETAAAGQGAAALLAVALSMLVMRRAAIFAVLALLVAENGIAIAAVSVSGGLPIVIELGVAFDLVLVALVGIVFHERIFRSFGTTDTLVLGELRDAG
jgi:hydrogenase-4 component E